MACVTSAQVGPAALRRCRRRRCRCRLAERPDVRDQLKQLLLGDQSLERRHDRLEARDDLGLWIHDRLPDVGLVGQDRAAALKLHRLAVHAGQHRSPPLRVPHVAGMADEILKQLRARGDRRIVGPSAAQPRLEVRRLHRDDRSNHSRVFRAAVLGAEEVVLAGLCRREPHRVVAAGNDVGLHAERGDEVAVEHILGAHDQLHGAPDGHVQLVDLALPVHVLHLPHPLLADDEDLHRARGRTVEIEEHLGAPHEHHHRDAERDERPEQLQRQRSMDRDADLVVAPASILHRENDDEDGDEQREECRDGDHEEVDGIDLARLHGRLLRKEWKVREHRLRTGLGARASRRARATRGSRRVGPLVLPARGVTVRNDRNTSTSRDAAPTRTSRSTAAPYFPVAGS